ncbi:AAA family ATPase [Kribbella qitaiheensis]|uniref:Nuclease SbcCD subunit C n=1 Tax=Kribbella qitaiheensis TaxID=1544730 RepID=A0A7G6WXI8_9ACTN|nr:AAA family ATPase [Kribbella qitaiheensis]QNE18703.1 AAA family ATPase [Kribbella qitaiheensis]
MRLQSITLTNFRQFADVQTFDLTSDSVRPVSLLFGANGAGKTTFLNAFTWALYGTMSDDVEQQDRMITDSIWRALPIGDSAEVAVEVRFDHEGRDYRVLRSAALRKESDQQGVFSPKVQLWTTKPDGSSETVGAPQETIHSILPRGVSRSFFFNGERIENLVKKGAYAEVQKDIKVLLDLEQVERAIAHLPKVDRKLTADLKKHGGDKASGIQEAIDVLDERETAAQEELKVLESDLATLTEERDSVTDLLRQHAESAPIQAERDAVGNELEEARSARDAAIAERALLVATRGFQAFTDTLSESTAAMAQSLYQKGALPAPLKREFVDQLLDDGSCICGTPLTEHSVPWEHVKDWRQRAGLQAVETAWQQLSGQIAPLSAARDELCDSLAALMKRIGAERDRVTRLEERKSELDGKLRDSRMEDVQALETNRMELDGRIGVKQQRIGAVKAELQTIAKEVDQKTKERSRAVVTDELATKARSRSDLVQSVKRALEDILAIREEDIRRRLDAELKAVFKSITHQNHVPTLSAGFELTLYKDVNGVQLPVPKSTGENQILSLSFVAAVSKLAREIRKERRAEGDSVEDAGTYPIVMDAAFGSLDQDYQEAVSRALAKMAPQLVVLVSKSQGLGKVVTELMPYVSHLGVIETHTTAPGSVSDDIELEGMSYPYIRAAESDHSELKVIK